MQKIKNIIKKIIGNKIIILVKTQIKIIKGFFIKITNKSIKKNNNLIEKIEVYELKNKNIFCGYYDLVPIKKDKMLVHVVDKNANTKRNSVEIGYFDINNKQYRKITDSKAWCWQQGSRLRWSETEDNVIYFNDVEKDRYCLRKYDVLNKKILKTIEYPIYDMNKDETFGISINFSRLQRLRPGYGYDYLKDLTIGKKAPKDDGIFTIDLDKGTSKLIISLEELAKLVDKDLKYEHYINHISFSPKGDKIMFFHLWTEKVQGIQWKNQLCLINIDGTDFKVLENTDIVSHYDWKNDNKILITGIRIKDKTEFYRYYDINSTEKEDVEDIELTQDGHPVQKQNSEIFYSDTYPNSNSMQKLFKYDLDKMEYSILMEVFSDPRLTSEKRCDLHPKLIENGEEIILIDSTFKKKKRSIVLIKLK